MPDLLTQMQQNIKALDKRITRLEATVKAEIEASKEVHRLIVEFIANRSN